MKTTTITTTVMRAANDTHSPTYMAMFPFWASFVATATTKKQLCIKYLDAKLHIFLTEDQK